MKLGFITESFGKYSEVWMWRQFVGMSKTNPNLLTWSYHNQEVFPIPPHTCFFANNVNNLSLRERLYIKIYQSITNNKIATPKSYKAIDYWINTEKIDRILCQFGYIGLKSLPVAHKNKIPIACHFHGYDLSLALKSDTTYKNSLVSNISKFNACIVVGSHQKKLLLELNIPSNKIYLIPCGVPVVSFPFVKRNPPNSQITFIIVSRLVPKKGVLFSIKAFERILNQVECKLIILGEGYLHLELQSYINDNRLSNYISIKGEVTSKEVLEYLISSDIFLQHSIQSEDGDEEGFGVSVAEASSTGLPVICSRSPGLIDQVIDGVTGFLVPQKNIEVMAEKMLILARDKELREKMGLAGHLRMKDHFDTAKQIAKLEKVLMEM